jgi:hypothetical protein
VFVSILISCKISKLEMKEVMLIQRDLVAKASHFSQFSVVCIFSLGLLLFFLTLTTNGPNPLSLFRFHKISIRRLRVYFSKCHVFPSK